MIDKKTKLQTDFPDQLRIQGINCKGYGILPKYVMIDATLTIESKTIYAYFCSYAGGGTTAFPSRDKILRDLGLSKDTYYKHFNVLLAQGYLTATQEMVKGQIFGRNVYTLISNPKKFNDEPMYNKDTSTYGKIHIGGLKAGGYGTIPKAIMIDDRLSLKSKGIYAYFCSFMGGGESAFPKLDNLLSHLNISEKTYYKYYNELITCNYIRVVQRHINGRMSINDYYLPDTPDESNAVKKSVRVSFTQVSKISDTVNEVVQVSKIKDTRKQDTRKQDTRKQDTINNSLINNNTSIINNNSINQSKVKRTYGVSDRLTDIHIKELFKDEVRRTIEDEWEIPYAYISDHTKMVEALHIITDYELFKNGYNDEFMQSSYHLMVEALLSMCCTKAPMTLKGETVTADMVVNRLNFYLTHSQYLGIMDILETAIIDFRSASVESNIKNHLQYMKACVWTTLQSGNISVLAQIKHDF